MVRYGGVDGSGTDVVGGLNNNRPLAATPLLLLLPLLPPWIKVEVDAGAYMSELCREVRCTTSLRQRGWQGRRRCVGTSLLTSDHS